MRLTIRNRARQMHAWLDQNFPTPYKTKLVWCPKIAADKGESPWVKKNGYFGETYWDGKSIIIRLSSRKCRTIQSALDTLMHEFAHAMTMPNDRVYRHRARSKQEHPDEWAHAFGKLYRGWIDDGGSEESRSIEL